MAVGACDPLQLKVQGLDRVFTVRPLVVEGLSREMNVGRDFLGRNRCALVFNAQGGELQVGGQATAILPREPAAERQWVPERLSGLEPQGALKAGLVLDPGGSWMTLPQSTEDQGHSEPYWQVQYTVSRRACGPGGDQTQT